ncbi:MAG: transcription antitermination factor NusB [Bifidobacteriaceae bacterium]|nr:transcription antitermination factor NusB [Bifidobacteriaceae bacterium]
MSQAEDSDARPKSRGGSRATARRRAVELVFEAFQRRLGLVQLLRQRAALRGSGAEGLPDAVEAPPYTIELVTGVAEHQTEISEWLDSYSQGWPQSRMPAVDRAILYVGAYEVVFEDDVPDPVVLKAAADLAGKLSTAKSADFVSGLLGRLAKIKATLR